MRRWYATSFIYSQSYEYKTKWMRIWNAAKASRKEWKSIFIFKIRRSQRELERELGVVDKKKSEEKWNNGFCIE